MKSLRLIFLQIYKFIKMRYIYFIIAQLFFFSGSSQSKKVEILKKYDNGQIKLSGFMEIPDSVRVGEWKRYSKMGY
jgi:hypothetical protein